MNDKTMTLEQVRDILEQAKEVCFKLEDGSRVYCGDMADAITRHLSQPAERGEAQENAEPVAWMSPESLVKLQERDMMALVSAQNWADGEYCLAIYTAPPPAAGVPDAREVLSEYVRICIDEHTDRAGSEHRVEAMARAIAKAMLSAAPEADHHD